MKKLIILILVLTLLSGCTIVRIDTESIDNIISVVLSKNNNLYNRVGKGYKYYVPRGVTYIDTNDLNEKLYSEGYYYYLYIDAISYYHNKKLEYTVNEKAYFSKKLDFNGKEGYLEINKQKNYYFIEFMYNYAKIEAVVPEDKIEAVILNSSYILSTVKFNNNVIELMLDDTYFTGREEVYDIFSAKEEANENVGRQWLETVDDGNIDGGE
jgi:hypothetical protein